MHCQWSYVFLALTPWDDVIQGGWWELDIWWSDLRVKWILAWTKHWLLEWKHFWYFNKSNHTDYNTRQFHYNTALLLQYTYKSQPMSCLWGWDMGFVWVQRLTHVLSWSFLCYIKQYIVLDSYNWTVQDFQSELCKVPPVICTTHPYPW